MVTQGNCPVLLGVLELCRQAAANLLLSSDSFSKNWPITFSCVSASGMLVNLIFFSSEIPGVILAQFFCMKLRLSLS